MPTVPCPCCKAVNTAGPGCRRCKADLGLLFAVATEHEALLEAASAKLVEGDGPAAVGLLDRALELRRTPEAVRLRAAAALVSRDFSAAAAWYSAACGAGQSPGTAVPGPE